MVAWGDRPENQRAASLNSRATQGSASFPFLFCGPAIAAVEFPPKTILIAEEMEDYVKKEGEKRRRRRCDTMVYVAPPRYDPIFEKLPFPIFPHLANGKQYFQRSQFRQRWWAEKGGGNT